ncbi:hypothetical protein FQN57_006727 [Myotisia sp. PD_48]|nr:hypothetical protein FQN57_006727 [Myotisia sp. PD_48]
MPRLGGRRYEGREDRGGQKRNRSARPGDYDSITEDDYSDGYYDSMGSSGNDGDSPPNNRRRISLAPGDRRSTRTTEGQDVADVIAESKRFEQRRRLARQRREREEQRQEEDVLKQSTAAARREEKRAKQRAAEEAERLRIAMEQSALDEEERESRLREEARRIERNFGRGLNQEASITGGASASSTRDRPATARQTARRQNREREPGSRNTVEILASPVPVPVPAPVPAPAPSADRSDSRPVPERRQNGRDSKVRTGGNRERGGATRSVVPQPAASWRPIYGPESGSGSEFGSSSASAPLSTDRPASRPPEEERNSQGRRPSQARNRTPTPIRRSNSTPVTPRTRAPSPPTATNNTLSIVPHSVAPAPINPEGYSLEDILARSRAQSYPTAPFTEEGVESNHDELQRAINESAEQHRDEEEEAIQRSAGIPTYEEACKMRKYPAPAGMRYSFQGPKTIELNNGSGNGPTKLEIVGDMDLGEAMRVANGNRTGRGGSSRRATAARMLEERI